MPIPKQTIDRVFDAAKIEEVVGDYVTLRKRGANMFGLCPFHNEKTPSFTVSPARGIYKCFGCGKAGNAIGFVMEVEQCSFPDAVRQVARKYHIEIEERQLTAEEQQRQDDRESMFLVNQFSNEFFQRQLWETAEGKMAGLGYLMQKRGIREDIIRKFQLGYSPEKSILVGELKAKGFQEKYYINDAENEPHIGTGVVCRSGQNDRLFDRFHGRVMFPFFSTSGKVTGFAGRIIKSVENVGKYVNSPTSPIFEKHNELYGFFQAKAHIQRQDLCYLVEGQLDVISMVQSGIENVVSSGGTSLTQPQIRLIHRFTPNLTIIYDGDKAGIKAALRGIDMVLREGMNVKIVLLPDGSDPDEFARTHTSDEMRQYIADHQVDFIRFKTQLLREEAGRDPQKLANLINDVVSSIALIPDMITRQVYIKDTSTQLGMQEALLSKRVQEIRRGEIAEEKKNTEKEKAEVAAPQKPLSRLELNYQNLLQVIIRYGERVLYTDPNGWVCRAADYIISELEKDDIPYPDALFTKVVDEYKAHHEEPNWVAEDFYKRHSDPEINALAIRLISNPYDAEMKSSVEPNLVSLIPRLICELKYTMVSQRIDALNKQLTEANERGDYQAAREVLAQQPMLIEIRKQLCAVLGNRVSL